MEEETTQVLLTFKSITLFGLMLKLPYKTCPSPRSSSPWPTDHSLPSPSQVVFGLGRAGGWQGVWLRTVQKDLLNTGQYLFVSSLKFNTTLQAYSALPDGPTHTRMNFFPPLRSPRDRSDGQARKELLLFASQLMCKLDQGQIPQGTHMLQKHDLYYFTCSPVFCTLLSHWFLFIFAVY